MTTMKFKPQFCLGFLFDMDIKNVLLMKKNRSPKGAEHMIGKLNGIGGHCEMGENFEDTMIRECAEETGLEMEQWGHFCDYEVDIGIIHCYWGRGNIHKFRQIEDEKLYICSLEKTFKARILRDFNSYYKDFPIVDNIGWLIPMAINDIDNNDGSFYKIEHEIN